MARYQWALAALLAWPSAAMAVTVGTGGAATLVPIAPDLTLRRLESATQIFVMDERQNVTLTAPLAVDVLAPGAYPTDVATGLTIPAGTVVSSQMVHFDPFTQGATAVALSGTATFDQPVLGLIADDPTLNASVGVVGVSTTTYPINGGLEANEDRVTLSADRKTVSFSLSATNFIDEVRVITAGVGTAPAPIPEPAVAALFGLASVALLRWRRR